MTARCVSCGHYLSYVEMEDGSAAFHFEPSSHFGPEVSEWRCARCTAADIARLDGEEMENLFIPEPS
jgi:hypothetical protein